MTDVLRRVAELVEPRGSRARPGAPARPNLLLLVLGATALFGCHSSTGSWHSTTELSEALLTVSDMGGEWRETQRDVFDERAVENPVIDSSLFCPAASRIASTLDALAGQAGADVEMQMKETTRMMRLQAWDNPDASAFFTAVSTAVTTCDGVEWTDADVGVTTTFEAVAGPTIGDDSVHWAIVSSPPADNPDGKFGGAGRTSVARFDDVIMVLQVGDFALDPTSVAMSPSDWRALVTLAAEKIGDL